MATPKKPTSDLFGDLNSSGNFVTDAGVTPLPQPKTASTYLIQVQEVQILQTVITNIGFLII